jgi:hypothetical protein
MREESELQEGVHSFADEGTLMEAYSLLLVEALPLLALSVVNQDVEG